MKSNEFLDSGKVGPSGGRDVAGRGVGTLGNQYAGECTQSLSRASLRDNLLSRMHRAQQSAGEARRLERFVELANKNPELFEMLELMRDLSLF